MPYFKPVQLENFQGYTIKILMFREVTSGAPYYEYQISLREAEFECSNCEFTWSREAYEKAQGRVTELRRKAMINEPRKTSLGATMKQIAVGRRLPLDKQE